MSDYLVEKSQADINKEGEERFRLALDSVGDGAVPAAAEPARPP